MTYITYDTATHDLPDIYAHAYGPVALRLGQANPLRLCYNYYIYTSKVYLPYCAAGVYRQYSKLLQPTIQGVIGKQRINRLPTREGVN